MGDVSPLESEPPFAPTRLSEAPAPQAYEAHRIFLSRSYFPLLDGLRCLSIVAVVWFHAAGGTQAPGILSRGEEGVSLFFVISGFLITTILLREQSTVGGISLKRFYLRRTLRIFPLYYAMLALYAMLVAIIEKQTPAGDQFWRNLPYFLTYTSNWFVLLGADRIIFFFAWSLATEEQFYLFWPWVVKATRGPGLPIAAMLGLLALHYGTIFAAADGAFAPVPLLTRALISLSPPICFGAIAAVLVHRPLTFRWIERWLGRRWSASAALAATLTALAFDETQGVVLYAAMTWLVVACSVRSDDVLLRAALTNPFVMHVGHVSYGIYLMHMLCINIMRRLVAAQEGPLIFVLALALSIAAATISYRFFEAPILRWKDRIAKQPAGIPAAPVFRVRPAP